LNELYPNENVDVPDPYFGMPNGFEIVYNMLDEVCDIIADKLKNHHKFFGSFFQQYFLYFFY
jgi:protein-tyrosine phosphatase